MMVTLFFPHIDHSYLDAYPSDAPTLSIIERLSDNGYHLNTREISIPREFLAELMLEFDCIEPYGRAFRVQDTSNAEATLFRILAEEIYREINAETEAKLKQIKDEIEVAKSSKSS